MKDCISCLQEITGKKIYLNGEETNLEHLKEEIDKKGQKIKLIENGEKEVKFSLFIKNP